MKFFFYFRDRWQRICKIEKQTEMKRNRGKEVKLEVRHKGYNSRIFFERKKTDITNQKTKHKKQIN
jgi:hypothetical protein